MAEDLRSSQDRCHICPSEIITFEQEGFFRRLCQRVCEAVSEIQPRGVSAPFAEIAVGFTGNPRLEFRYGVDSKMCLAEKIVESAARDRISAPIDNHSRFHEIHCRNAAAARAGYCLRARKRFRLIAKYGDDCGRIDDHRGKPFSSYKSSP